MSKRDTQDTRQAPRKPTGPERERDELYAAMRHGVEMADIAAALDGGIN